MRNPKKAARRWGVAAAVAIACAAAPFLLYEHDTDSSVPVVLTIIAVTIGPLAIYFLIDALVAARRLARLRRGEGLLARWRLTPEEWRAFVHGDQQRNADDPELMNTLTTRKSIPKRGVEVLVGEKEISVDGYVQSMRVGGFASSLVGVEWRAGAPSVIACRFRVPTGRYSSTITAWRFPVASDARPEGMRVYQHFRAIAEQAQTRTSIAMRNPKRTLQVCGALLIICVVAAFWGFANRDGGDQLPILPLVAAVCGVIIGIACLLLIAIVAFGMRRGRA